MIEQYSKRLSRNPEQRLSTVVSYLSANTTQSQYPTMADRPFITCHVLDTVTGRPGARIDVILKLLSPESSANTTEWVAETNNDGRVTAWEPINHGHINDVVAKVKSELSEGDQMTWSLAFNTESYFGKGKTFWPEVELRFAAKKEEEHYHVPLLLGPWSYTTYRGS